MTLIYAAVGALWILVSDRAVESLFDAPETLLLASTVKGWLFVGVTSLLLYGLLRRRLGGPDRDGAAAGPAVGVLPFALFAVVVVVLSASSIFQTLERHHEKDTARLRAIVLLKAGQIAEWLEERRNDAETVRANRHLADLYAKWRRRGDGAAAASLRTQFEHWSRAEGFSGVMLFDPGGRLSWATRGARPELAAPLREAMEATQRDGRIRRVGLYRDARGDARLDFVVPLGSPPASPLAVLQTDPAAGLHSALANWPGPDSSGQLLLVRRDGDEAVFLAEHGRRPGSPAGRRAPLNERRLLAAQVLGGEVREGEMAEGEDRGTPVVGVAQAVAGTDWSLIAQLDRAEWNAEGLIDSTWIALAGLLALFVAGTGYFMVRERSRLALADNVRELQAERLRALQLLGAIADNSADAIFAKGLDGRYIFHNRAVGRFIGRDNEDILGRDDRAILPPELAASVQAADREIVEQGVTRRFEEDIPGPHGVITIDVVKMPLRDEAGRVAGVFGIARDITGRKKAEQALRDSEDRFRTLFEGTAAGILVHDKDSGSILQANRHALESHGFETIEQLNAGSFGPPPYARDDAVQKIRAARQGPQRFEWVSRRSDGSEFWQDIQMRTVVLDGVERVLAVAHDIGDRKAAEEELRSRNAELERFNRAVVGRELDMIEMKKRINELSRELGREPPYALDLLEPEKPRS